MPVAKKRKRVAAETSDASELTHSPFAALGGSAEATEPAETVEPAETAGPADTSISFDAKIVVRREKKGRGGKTVTRITGLPVAHREAIAASMKKALGCGATVDGEDVVLLGALVARTVAWLEGEGAKRVVAGN